MTHACDVVPEEDESALKQAVAHQPIATAIQANQRAFQLYGGGVFTDDCGTQLDHGVLIAGYGRENHTDYWLIKNSWGSEWGDEGYIKLERGRGDGPGKCGLAIGPSFPIKKHNNPPRPPKPGACHHCYDLLTLLCVCCSVLLYGARCWHHVCAICLWFVRTLVHTFTAVSGAPISSGGLIVQAVDGGRSTLWCCHPSFCPLQACSVLL